MAQSTSKRADCLRSGHYFTPNFPLHIMEVPQSAMEAHSHEFYEMVYVRRGRGEHCIDDRAYPIQAGDLYVIHPGEEHRYAPLSGGQLRIVNVLWMPALVKDILAQTGVQSTLEARNGEFRNGESLFYLEPFFQRLTKTSSQERFAHRLHLAGRTAYRVENLLDEMRREQLGAAPGSRLLLRHLFCALLVLLSREHQQQYAKRASSQNALDEAASLSSQHAIVARAIEWIEENFARPIRVRDVASHAALSESRLSHVFKAHTGRGVIEYLHEYRIGRICAGLCETDRPIASLASEAGFNDSRFFHRVFARHAGCNPTQYRRHFSAANAI